MDMERIKQVCKIGQGAACCKYLACGANGMECAKLSPVLMAAIDRREDMTAKGDNCPGDSALLE
jgi:hypothetical protein